MNEPITPTQFHHTEGVEDWRFVAGGACTYFSTGSFLAGAELELARQISAAARELGLTGDPSAAQTVQVTIDALVRPDVTPFWRALLGYVERDGPDDLMDPRGRGPAFYFAQLDAPRPQRNRIHVDVYVPYDQAEARVAAAIAAGGHLVTDEYVPFGWWVLADAEGNEACVALAAGSDPEPERIPPHKPGAHAGRLP